MAITQFIVVPSRATGQDTFSADAEVFWGQLPTFVTEVNSFITSLNGSWTSSSVTSLLVGTGSKTLTVGTGLGFQVGMPVRLANTDSIYMTGDVTSYNSVTGELVCNITSSTGSGTYASWSVYAIAASVGASLVANKFSGLQTFADEVAVASASTINITTADSNNIEITGTTTITAVTMPEGAVIKARASGAFQLTNSSSLIVQGNANYTTTVNDILTFTKDGAGNVHVEIDRVGGQLSKIQSISASVASNALTITLNPTSLDFRSSTLTSGTVNTRGVSSAISVVVSSGSTLGTINAIQSRLAVLAIDNAGTVELAVVNMAGGNQLDETNLITTVAEGGAGGADSANVIYSTTGRTNVPYRVVGYVESTQATAGTWATAPSTIQGYGGQALAALSSLGYGQIWQDVTGSRTFATTYYNTTGKPIKISVYASGPGSVTVSGTLNINGVVYAFESLTTSAGQVYHWNIREIIPAGASYSITQTNSTLIKWSELR